MLFCQFEDFNGLTALLYIVQMQKSWSTGKSESHNAESNIFPLSAVELASAGAISSKLNT